MIFEDKHNFKPIFESAAFVNILCYKHQKHNLLSLRDILGDRGFVTMLDKFAGTYTKFPSASHTLQLINDLYLVTLYQDLQAKSKANDPLAWQAAENRFNKFVKQMKYKEKAVRARIKATLKLIDQATEWYTKLKLWEKKNRERGLDF